MRKKAKMRNIIKELKYSVHFPKRGNFSSIVPDLPYSYNYEFNLNLLSQQGNIGKKKYFEPKENDILGENCSYKKINVLPFVEINHIHSTNYKSHVICSFFFRYRNKFSTFLYYKKNKKNKSIP